MKPESAAAGKRVKLGETQWKNGSAVFAEGAATHPLAARAETLPGFLGRVQKTERGWGAWRWEGDSYREIGTSFREFLDAFHKVAPPERGWKAAEKAREAKSAAAKRKSRDKVASKPKRAGRTNMSFSAAPKPKDGKPSRKRRPRDPFAG